jgi:hypothetical protein
MNDVCYQRLMADEDITIMCKSWLWLRKCVFNSERWRRWHGLHVYPFLDPQFCDTDLQIPLVFLGNALVTNEFYSYCEHWFEKCCVVNTDFEIQSDLPFSDGGLGLVCIHDVSDQQLGESVTGVLEFMDEDIFEFLRINGCSSLYVTNEGDFCILIGPLSLCNNGRSVENVVRFPRFTDRGFLDEELMYHGFRREFINVDQPAVDVFIEFEHYSLKMDVLNDTIRLSGSQIFVDYGFVTIVAADNLI